MYRLYRPRFHGIVAKAVRLPDNAAHVLAFSWFTGTVSPCASKIMTTTLITLN